MLKYLNSLIWGEREEFTLEEAYKVLEENVENRLENDDNLEIDFDEVLHLKADENNWDENTVEKKKDAKCCFRTIVAHVHERNGRKLILNPNKIEVDLDQISLEFLPIVGDWVQLEAKCELDETVVDLHGKIVEILRIIPSRPQIQQCQVSIWNSEKKEGILNNSIYFNKDSLVGGYFPVKNDRVIAETIESTQGRCSSRALKIVPEFMKNVSEKIEHLNKKTIDGLLIKKPEILCFEKLTKEATLFTISIVNEKNSGLDFEGIEFKRGENSQCKFKLTSDYTISENCLEIVCQCVPFQVGKSREYFTIHTNLGELFDWIDVSVETQTHRFDSGRFEQRSSYKHREKYEVVGGMSAKAPPRFIAIKCPLYPLPNRILNIATETSTQAVLYEKLCAMKPCLDANLSPANYLDKFHTLLYLEEVQNVIEMSKYDSENAVFIRNNEYLMLEIQNLSEKRPSIIVGDKIYARDSHGVCKTEFEGFVHKVGARHVYLKFSPIFQDSYDGEDYSVHVVSSRTATRRLHHAIDLVVKNLGNDLLFPSKIEVKIPQFNLKVSKKDLIKSLRNKSELPQLEWYNSSLNLYQKEAVKNVLTGELRPLPYIIFGPPGTGKTVTLVECILQIVRHLPSARLLVTAPSNSAADLITKRLIKANVLKPGDLIRYVSYNHLQNLPDDLLPYSTCSGDFSREGTNTELAKTLENGLILGCSSQVLGRHQITVTTCSSAGALYQMGFPKGHFSHIFVDEAGQAMEPEIMIPLAFLDKASGQIVLAGDPQQLGPVVLSKIAEESGLRESYVERILNRFPYVRDTVGFPETNGYDPRLVTKLLCNYRSHPTLLKLTSMMFYNDELIPMMEIKDELEILEKLNGLSVNGKKLSASLNTGKFSKIPQDEDTNAVFDKLSNQDSVSDNFPEGNVFPNIIFHGVNGENYQTADSPSWFNPSEASQVFFYINELYRLGLKAEDIGVISPYIKQVKEIRAVLNEAEFDIPRIGSIEEFQGQEFNVVILSTVRSNQDLVTFDVRQNLGFVSSWRRLNVAISRARILLIVVGNPNLLNCDKYWRSVIEYSTKNGACIGYFE